MAIDTGPTLRQLARQQAADRDCVGMLLTDGTRLYKVIRQIGVVGTLQRIENGKPYGHAIRRFLWLDHGRVFARIKDRAVAQEITSAH